MSIVAPTNCFRVTTPPVLLSHITHRRRLRRGFVCSVGKDKMPAQPSATFKIAAALLGACVPPLLFLLAVAIRRIRAQQHLGKAEKPSPELEDADLLPLCDSSSGAGTSAAQPIANGIEYVSTNNVGFIIHLDVVANVEHKALVLSTPPFLTESQMAWKIPRPWRHRSKYQTTDLVICWNSIWLCLVMIDDRVRKRIELLVPRLTCKSL